MPSVLSKIAIGVGVAVGVYGIILGALLTPYLQRFSVYAHKISTPSFIHNVNNPEQFGFAKNQVTPFTIRSLDGTELYAWHVLPHDIYARNEQALLEEKRPAALKEDFHETTAFRLLTSGDARVVVNFHGNAGHVAQGWRTDTYRLLASQPNTHVITIDYRGFGQSAGSPTEPGLIADGTALLNWILYAARIPPERIVLLGQSLGTAVASAVALRFVDPYNPLIPSCSLHEDSPEMEPFLQHPDDPALLKTFAGVILVAPFSSLPSLMLTYRIGGIFPILLPLRPFPGFASWITEKMVDTWPTAERLAAYYQALGDNPKFLIGQDGRRMGGLQVLHATNDADISYHQTEMICRRMLGNSESCANGNKGASVVDVRRENRPGVRFEIVEHGGHNRIVTYSQVAVAVVRAFEDLWP